MALILLGIFLVCMGLVIGMVPLIYLHPKRVKILRSDKHD